MTAQLKTPFLAGDATLICKPSTDNTLIVKVANDAPYSRLDKAQAIDFINKITAALNIKESDLNKPKNAFKVTGNKQALLELVDIRNALNA